MAKTVTFPEVMFPWEVCDLLGVGDSYVARLLQDQRILSEKRVRKNGSVTYLVCAKSARAFAKQRAEAKGAVAEQSGATATS